MKLQANEAVPVVLKTRDSEHLIPGEVKVADRFYPKTEDLSYDNYIVGFQQKYTELDFFNGVNVIMKKGDRSQYPLYHTAANGWSDVRI